MSGVDQLILIADMARREGDEAFARAMVGAFDAAHDFLAKPGDRLTWGTLYLEHARKEACDAIHTFAEIDPTNVGAVVACQAAVREYTRVAGFLDRLLKEATDVVDEPADEDPDDPQDGDPEDDGGHESDGGSA